LSFDVFLQRFQAAEAAEADHDVLSRLLQPYLIENGPGSADLLFGDGDAAIYGTDDLGSGFMVNHVSGRQAWDVLAAVACEVGLTILAVGCPAAVPSEDLIGDLPAELRQDAIVVRSGEDLIRMIEAA
jgi:hypothetical protein